MNFLSILQVLKSKQEGQLREDSREILPDFESIYYQWIGPVYRYLCVCLENDQDAEDLTAAVFLAVLQGLPQYQPRGNFAGWLFRIARNKAIEWKRKTRREVNLPEIPEPVEQTDFLSGLSAQQDIQELRKMIECLPEEEKELLNLRYAADLTFSEIGAIVGRTEGAVKKSVYRLQEKLYGQMEKNHA
jgi:RNA polymerase sigma-70 factor (ECF subfamily)